MRPGGLTPAENCSFHKLSQTKYQTFLRVLVFQVLEKVGQSGK